MVVFFQIENPVANLNGEYIVMDIAPKLINYRTYIHANSLKNIFYVAEEHLASIETYRVYFPDYLILVNHYNYLGRYSPADLVYIGNGQRLREVAATAFLKMRNSMHEHGLFIIPRSGFRDYNTQRFLWNNAVEELGLASARRWFARAGYSEHQTGLAVDIVQRGFTGQRLGQANFANTRQFAWLNEWAHVYGFTLRYRREYEHITGVAFEPWHWRYVGVSSATYMRDNGIRTFEQYIERRRNRS